MLNSVVPVSTFRRHYGTVVLLKKAIKSPDSHWNDPY